MVIGDGILTPAISGKFSEPPSNIDPQFVLGLLLRCSGLSNILTAPGVEECIRMSCFLGMLYTLQVHSLTRTIFVDEIASVSRICLSKDDTMCSVFLDHS